MGKGVFYGVDCVELRDEFFLRYKNLIAGEVIFDQWDILCDKKEGAQGHAVVNFEICAKEKSGNFKGFVFQDSDLYKWLEAAGNILAQKSDKKLKAIVEYCITLIEKSQQPDGYINTYFTLEKPDKKFKNLTDSHELYCAGHFFEAVVSVYNAIKSEKLLIIANKFADLLVKTFGNNKGQICGADGHEEVELALIRLYEITKNPEYYELARFFLDTRGTEPNFFIAETNANKGANIWSGWLEKIGRVDEGALVYLQANKPVKSQTVAAGHAVRVTYLIIALAAAAKNSGDEYYKTAKTIWDNIVNSQMYVTGGVGQTNIGEAFTTSYDLPNTTAYSETCASIGMALSAKRMLENEQDAEFSKVLQRELFNGIIAGISYDCEKYFYVNPLEVNPIRDGMVGLEYVKQNRQAWHGCACCPPNLSRFLTSVESCIFSKVERAIFINQLISSELNSRGDIVEINVSKGTQYSATIKVLSARGFDTLAFYVPDYLENSKITINNVDCDAKIIKGFSYVTVKKGDVINICGTTRPKFIKCNNRVNYNAAKVCVMFGDFVMCCEQIDNGENLHNLIIDANSTLEVVDNSGALKVIAKGAKYINNNSSLYFEDSSPQLIKQDIVFIPYYYWNNRGSGEMAVWITKAMA